MAVVRCFPDEDLAFAELVARLLQDVDPDDSASLSDATLDPRVFYPNARLVPQSDLAA